MTSEQLFYTFLSSLIALFPVMNPISSGFIINAFLEDADPVKRMGYVKKIIVNTVAIGVGSLLVGHIILLVFGLAIPVIQVGGGVVICMTGLQWLSDSGNKSVVNKERTISAIDPLETERKLFYPLSFPLSIGPGTISVIFTLMATASDKADDKIPGVVLNYLMIAVAIVALCTLLYLFLSQGERLMKVLGPSANMIINKFIAFITFCIGLQILVTGIGKIFHIAVL